MVMSLAVMSLPMVVILLGTDYRWGMVSPLVAYQILCCALHYAESV